MSEEEFLQLVASCAAYFKDAYNTGAAWEIGAQIAISIKLQKEKGIPKPREFTYPGSEEKCDFSFTKNGTVYAIELKVEASDGRFGGTPMGTSMVGDVNKLHTFDGAVEKWFMVVAISDRARRILMAQLDRGDSWIGTEKDGVAIGLCNINTYPRGLPWVHVDDSVVSADKQNVRAHGFL